ncbi:MAG: DUF418 domain-containing protein [Myxococcales bacterium]|nr:DUF418 domain-containing protein [Myxococcales bacterium]
MSETARPVAASSRILALDVLRGVAVFGILFVNIAVMSGPIVWAMAPDPQAAAPLPDTLIWAGTKALCEGKFIALFSLMFGMGLQLQTSRLDARGQPVNRIYVRRLLVLAVFGAIHGALLWWGDILFVYATVGFVVFWAHRWPARRKLQLAAVLLGAGWLLQSSNLALGALFWDPDPPPMNIPPEALAALPESLPPWIHEAFRQTDPLAMASTLEIGAYGQGPWVWSGGFRLVTWLAMVLLNYPFGGILLWVGGMFFAGMAALQSGLFDEDSPWPRRLVLVALPVGLLFEIGTTGVLVATGSHPYSPLGVAMWVVSYFSKLALAGGYLGAVIVLTRRVPFLLRALAAPGRLALTLYLMQTVLVTSVMLHWGGGLFGQLGRPELLGIVLAVILLQLVFANLWLVVFSMGPLERLWRWLTYGRARPVG